MNSNRKSLAPFLLVVGSMLVLPSAVYAARHTQDKAEAQQSTEDMSPQGQYKIAKKEADAAYRDALADCKKLSKAERTSCAKEAKANHQADLSQAKKALSSGQ